MSHNFSERGNVMQQPQPHDKSGKPIKKLKRKVPTRDVDGIVKLEKTVIEVPGQKPQVTISEEHKLWFRGPMFLDAWRLLRDRPVVYCYFRMVKGEMQLIAEAPNQKW